MLVVSHLSRYSLKKFTTIYLNLSKLCPKYCRSLFSQTRLAITAFSMTSQLRHHYVVRASIDTTFYHFSVTRTVGMICAKHCEKLSKFVEVIAKILPVPFFLGHGVYAHLCVYTGRSEDQNPVVSSEFCFI